MNSAENYLSLSNLLEIREIIQEELLKRGFTAPILKIEETVDIMGSHHIELSTAYFQTTPVIFKKLRITNFNTSVSIGKLSDLATNATPNLLDKDYVMVWVTTNLSYESFGGGSNGLNLLNFWFNVFGKKKFDVKISHID